MADLTVSTPIDTFMQATTVGQMVAALANGGTALTATRVTFAGTAGVLQDSANLTFSGTVLNLLDAGSISLGTTTPGTLSGILGALTFAAAGTNQNITLTPSGTGINLFGTAPAGGAVQSPAGTVIAEAVGLSSISGSPYFVVYDSRVLAANNGGGISFVANTRSAGNGYVPKEMGYIVGGKLNATDNDDGGYLAFVTRRALGAGFGEVFRATDSFLQMTGANRIKFGATADATIGVTADTSAGTLKVINPGTGGVEFDFLNSGTTGILMDNTGSAFRPAGSVNIPLGSSADRWNGLYLKSTSFISFGATSDARIGVSVDTTAGNLNIITPTTGNLTVQKSAGGAILTVNPNSGSNNVQVASSSNALQFTTSSFTNALWLSATGVLVGTATDDGVHALQVAGAGGISTNTIGGTLFVKSGSNAKAGTFTLSSGAATVSNTSVTANSVINFTIKTVSGTLGVAPQVTATIVGTSFTVTGAATNNSTYNYVIEEVN